MSEEEINIKYIRHRLGVDMLLAKEILKLCSERYIEGIEQGKFDRLMLEQENQELKEQLENASKNYTKYIQERDNVLNEIRKYIKEKEEDGTLWSVKATDGLLQILDKVKENE